MSKFKDFFFLSYINFLLILSNAFLTYLFLK